MEARDEIAHPQPHLGVRLALATILAACREAIVLRPASLPNSLSMPDAALSRELAAMMHAYLTARPASANDE